MRFDDVVDDGECVEASGEDLFEELGKGGVEGDGAVGGELGVVLVGLGDEDGGGSLELGGDVGAGEDGVIQVDKDVVGNGWEIADDEVGDEVWAGGALLVCFLQVGGEFGEGDGTGERVVRIGIGR